MRALSQVLINVVVFLAFLCGASFPLKADSVHDELYLEISRLIASATRKKTGLVLWTDLRQNSLQIEGDSRLAGEKFRPGSIFKLLTAEAALHEGLDFHYRCSGHDRVAGTLQYCWNHRGHGELDLPKALALSCNLFFSQLSLKLSPSSLLATLKSYPDFDAEGLYYKKFSPAAWAKLAIGDSAYFKVTPRQMMSFWKQYLEKLQDPQMAPIVQGLRRSVQEGTASKRVKNSFKVLAKTGTSDAEDPSYKTDAWFLGAYPDENPRFVFVIFLRRAHGYEEAAALANNLFKVFAKYFPS